MGEVKGEKQKCVAGAKKKSVQRECVARARSPRYTLSFFSTTNEKKKSVASV